MSSQLSTDLGTTAADSTSAGVQNQHVAIPFSTFTCFPKLPKELRLKIWMHAAFETRNIAVWVNIIELGEIHDGNGDNRPYFFSTNIGPPEIIHTCQESRSEGLKYYTLSLGSTSEEVKGLGHPPFILSCPPRTYINWKADRLCIMDPTFRDHQMAYLAVLDDARMNKLTRIAFNVKASGNPQHLFKILEYAALLHEVEEFVLFDTFVFPNWFQVKLSFEQLKVPYAVSDDLDQAQLVLAHTMKLTGEIKSPVEKEKEDGSGEEVEEEGIGNQIPYKIHLSHFLCDDVPM